MKSLVIYYSESGNTRKIARHIASGLNTSAYPYDEVNVVEIQHYDLICIGTPVHGNSPAKSVTKLVSAFPTMPGKMCATFCTAHMFGMKQTLQKLKRQLEAKELNHVGSFSALGLSRLVANFGPRIFNRGRPSAEELAAAELFGKDLAKLLYNKRAI